MKKNILQKTPQHCNAVVFSEVMIQCSLYCIQYTKINYLFSMQLPQIYHKFQEVIHVFLIITVVLMSRFSPCWHLWHTLTLRFVLTQLSMDFKEVTNTGGPRGSNLEQYFSQVRYTANSPDFIGIHNVNENKHVTVSLQIQPCFTVCDFFFLFYFIFYYYSTTLCRIQSPYKSVVVTSE